MKALGYTALIEGHSARRQQDGIRTSFGRTYGVNWYSDHGLNDASPRPKLAELVSDALEANVHSVLIQNFASFANRHELRAAICGVVRGFGLDVQSAHHESLEAPDIADAVSATLASIIEALKRRGAFVAERGRQKPGPKPYGTASDAKQGNREGQIRDEMFRLKAQGWGLRRIANKLNAEGKRTRRNSLWHPQSVARVLAAAAP